MKIRILTAALLAGALSSARATEPPPAPAGSVARVSAAAPGADEAAKAVSAELQQAQQALVRIQSVERQAAPDAKQVKEAAVQYRQAFTRAVDKVEEFRAQGADVRVAESDVTRFIRGNDAALQKALDKVPEEARAEVKAARECHGKGRALGHQKGRGKGHQKGKGKGHQKYDKAPGTSAEPTDWSGSGVKGGSSGGGKGQGRGRSGK
jgi:ABC-type transporter Mla subunit MlaD